ncbi:MAG: TIGR04255 family protein, partial [Microcystaceae cyanobacterium]
MLSQSLVEELFPNSPLKEVIFEVKFPLNLRVMRDICEFQEKIQDEYISFGIEEFVSSDKPTEIRYVFQNETEEKTLVVERESFTFLISRYYSFESFLAELSGYLEIFFDLFKIEKILNTRLNYVNNVSIELDQKFVSTRKYVKPYVDVNLLDKSNEIKRFATQIVKEREDLLLIVSSALIPNTTNDGQGTYILDINAIYEQTIL